MPTSAPGSDRAALVAQSPRTAAVTGPRQRRGRGFTLIELLVVVALIAIASAGAVFALRDDGSTQLEREAQRLAALLESARAQSRASGTAVRWHATAEGFRFEGVPPKALPQRWLGTDTQVQGTAVLVLGPEPIIGRQSVTISSISDPARSLRLVTDGLRPFSVAEPDSP